MQISFIYEITISISLNLLPEVVQHHPGGAGVHHVPEAEVRHPVQEREDVAPRLLHRQHHDPRNKD